jgi:general secretion pathway protein I
MRRAFTMIEVLVAMAIFAMATIILAGGYLNTLTAYDRARDVMTSDNDVKFARQSLLTMTNAATIMGTQFQYTTADGGQLTWTADITPSEYVADLFTVTFACEINPPNSSQPSRTLSESFQVLRPTWSTAFPGVKQQLQSDATQRIQNLNGGQ